MRLSNLADLESKGLVSLVSAEPELEYAFKHSLTYEAAYSSLTRANRKQLHRQVGLILQELYPNRLDELAPVLASHFFEAGENELSFGYYFRAGKSAQQKYANEEASMLYSKALKISTSLSLEYGIAGDQLIDLYLRKGRVLELAGKYHEALDHYIEMEQNGQQRGDPRQQLAALMARLTIMSTPTVFLNPDSARQISTQALEIAHHLQDRGAESKILWNMMLFNFFDRRIPEARQAGETSLAIARELNLTEQIAYTLNGLGSFVYLFENTFEHALATLEEGEKLWRQLDNVPMLADTLTSAASIYFMLGKFEKSFSVLDESCRLSDATGNQWGKAYCLGSLGFVYAQTGQISKAFDSCGEAITLAEQSGFSAMVTMSLFCEAYLCVNIGDYDRGIERARQALAHADKNAPFWLPLGCTGLAYASIFKGDLKSAGELLERSAKTQLEGETYEFLPIFHLANCELFLARNDYEKLFTYTNSYLAYIRNHNLMAYLPSGLYYRGIALSRLGRLDEGLASLVESENVARQLGILYGDWQALSALVALDYPAAGSQAQWREQARQALDLFADQIEDKNLKQIFLSRPDVAEFLLKESQ